jgi:hypothetical protein
MAEGRLQAGITLLKEGQVLVTGGLGGSDLASLSSAEIYDPAINVWSTVQEMHSSRAAHTATLLADGKVLVAGGASGSTNQPLGPARPEIRADAVATAEIYDTATRSWRSAASMSTRRFGHTATLLPDGHVLVVGGDRGNLRLGTGGGRPQQAVASMEIYDPTADEWISAGTLRQPRYGHQATLMLGGSVLISGGGVLGEPIALVEIYDPRSQTARPSGNMPDPRYDHATVLMPNDDVVVFGGRRPGTFSMSPTQYLRSVHRYSPRTDMWSWAGDLIEERGHPTATLLPNGDVVILGGALTNSGEVYRLAPDWSPLPWAGAVRAPIGKPSPGTTASGHAILLPRGQILVVAGRAEQVPSGGTGRPGGLVFFTDPPQFPQHIVYPVLGLYDPSSNSWAGMAR